MPLTSGCLVCVDVGGRRLLGALYLGENDVAGQRVLQSLASLVPQKAHEGDDNVDGSFKRRRQDALAGGLLSGAPPPRSAFSGDARSPQRLHHANSFDSAVQNASAAASLLAMAHRSAHSGQGEPPFSFHRPIRGERSAWRWPSAGRAGWQAWAGVGQFRVVYRDGRVGEGLRTYCLGTERVRNLKTK